VKGFRLPKDTSTNNLFLFFKQVFFVPVGRNNIN